jgi:ATP-dependent DNA ligase
MSPDPTPLTLADVGRAFADAAAAAGAGSRRVRETRLADLARRASADEREFLDRIIGGELRTGVSHGLVLEAIALAAGADVAIGSRAMTAAGIVVRARPHRVLAGRVFNTLAEWLGLRGIRDSQCGFKAFTAAAAADLFARLRTLGFGFDVELLLRARARGWRIAEVAVNWEDQPASKVGVVTDGPRMMWQIIAARLRVAREERRR